MERRDALGGRRLPPNVRQNLILDATAALILSEGLSAVSMERVGREAKVSKALVYLYFESRIGLLRALYRREQSQLVLTQRKAAERAEDFAQLISMTTRNFLEHTDQKGLLVQRLMSEPAVADVLSDDADANRARDYIAAAMAEEFALPLPTAQLVTEMCMALTASAGQAIVQSGHPVDTVETTALAIFEGGLPAVAKRFS